MNIAEQLRHEAAERILIKDGAYGTEVQARKLNEADYRGRLDLDRDQKGNNDLLNLTRPELIGEIAESFACAGADILATNSFNANRISQADYGAEHLVREMNVASARIIAETADRHSQKDGRAPVRRRRGRADQQDPVAVAQGQRSRLSAKSISISSATSMSSRSRPWSRAAPRSC